jgi:hypothetical protein
MEGRYLSTALLALAVACGGADSSDPAGPSNNAAANGDRPESCPAQAPAPSPLPNVTEAQRTAAYWIERARQYGDPDEPLLSAEDIQNLNAGLALPVEERPLGQIDLSTPVDEALVLAEVQERIEHIRGKMEREEYLDAEGERIDDDVLAAFASVDALPQLTPSLRRARERIQLRCGPTLESFYTPSLDLDFDRNNCSSAHAGEPVQVLASWSGDLLLVRTPYALGWVSEDAPLSDPVEGAEAEALLSRPSATMSRRDVIESAFAMLGEPYGWGGHEGGRDCSRFLMDLFSGFGIGLPRHSARQALAGTFTVDVSTVASTREKLLLFEEAARRGVVLLHFPGHIMLYLGTTEDGTPMAIHSFSEYLEPCEGVTLADGSEGEILRRVDEITVSDLSLGEGSSRTSFLERVTRISVLGRPPGPALRGVAELRAPAPIVMPEECSDSLHASIFRSPARTNADQPLKVIVTLSEDPGPVDLVLHDPRGNVVEADVHRLGGPPFTYWAKVDRPAQGRWTAILGDGTRSVACERFSVLRDRGPRPQPSTHAWDARWAWEADTENLYAAWVEQLFDYPPEEDLTWTSLTQLLRNQDNNLLYDHLSQDEDQNIRLVPDCADLPYFLRAYFSWKLRLPFAFRRCSRGRAGVAPHCNDLNTNLVPREGVDEAASFSVFIRSVANGVHSASARTLPTDDDTDVYPIPMERSAITPGTVYADPYGHLLVVAQWIPQGTDRYGMMIGADAQPDGTVGRRRFWRGSFLFDPSTEDVGAGFQAWRPLVYDRRAETITSLDNDTLRRTREHTPWSMEQYEGTVDDFYDEMEAIINPRPLDPEVRMLSLVDALDEAVARRVVSMQNGIEFQEQNHWGTIEMPDGYSIFETTGPWEDYSSPARDMRLLISIDAVVEFPDVVERVPEQFGLTEEEAPEAVAALRERLGEILSSRRFEYVRSNGESQELTLGDVVERKEAFEMSYNPNDCIEIRWAAPEGSDELASCRHHAPRAQRQRMEEYREWFQNRRRPPR